MKKVEIIGGPEDGEKYAFSGTSVVIERDGKKYRMDVYVKAAATLGGREEYRAKWSERKEVK